MSHSNNAESMGYDEGAGNTEGQVGVRVSSKSVRLMSDSQKRRITIGKADARYWLHPGKLLSDPRSRFLVCKIQVGGKRESFPLRTANKATAAAKAAKIYGDVISLGWAEAIARHKLETVKTIKSATVGTWLEAVRATTDFRPTTFTTYGQCLRQIVSEIADIGDQPALDAEGNVKRDRKRRLVLLSRFDYRTGGREAWRIKVDEQPLDILTPEAVQRWRMAYVARAGSAPDAKRRAENSAAALIRNARALFSDKAIKFVGNTVAVPDPLPFTGVKLEKRGSTRYQSKIDAHSLIAKAQEQLTGEPFKIFCLGMLCGLRKKEIDALLWSQVDFVSGQIRIEATEHFQPKSEDSIGAVDLDEELLALLRGWKVHATGAFVIESSRAPRYDHSRTNYRATVHFETLYKWLKEQGITARKPLHELRKELGALLASQEGIFAAQRQLRHAQISTTAAYYTDKKKRISAGLGALLNAKEGSIAFPTPEATECPAVSPAKEAKRRSVTDAG